MKSKFYQILWLVLIPLGITPIQAKTTPSFPLDAGVLQQDIVVNKVSNLDNQIYKRSVFLELPFIFPDYEVAYKFVSPIPRGYLYPQGFSHDANNNTYINYAASKPYGMVLVKYDKNGIYKGWVRVISGLIEDIVVKDEKNILKLYTKNKENTLVWADITSLKWNGDIIKPTSIPIVKLVGLRMDYEKGMWIIEQINKDQNNITSRVKFRIYDDQFNQIGEFFVARNIVGFQTPKFSMYPYIPKMQGVVLKNRQVYIGTGGSYIPWIDGEISPPVSALGIAKLGLDGTLINYGTIRASDYLKYKKKHGYNYAIRTEAEGLSKLGDGTVTQLVILSNRNISSKNKISGIVIEKLLDPKGVDYSEYKQSYKP